MLNTEDHNFKYTIGFKTIFMMLVISMGILSCSGQTEKNITKRGVIQTDTKSTPTEKQQPYVDPLLELEGQLCQHLRKIYQDKKGDLWFGTNNYGIMRYDGDTLVYFNEQHGLGEGRITAILEDAKGVLWIGTAGGLSKFNPVRESMDVSNSAKQIAPVFTNYTQEDGLINNEVWSVTIDQNGIFWIGTLEGVSRFDGKTFTDFPIPKATVKDTNSILSYNRITCSLEDQNGVLWFGTDGFGICKYDPSAEAAGRSPFSHLTKANGLSDNNVADLYEDQKGNIWIGSMYGGLCKYDPVAEKSGVQAFTYFTKDGVIEGEEVYGFHEDRKGNLWFAAENFGVYCYDGKTFRNFYKKDGLVTNGVLSFLEDREGRFWMGGWMGLFRFYADVDKGSSFESVTKDGPWE